MSLGMISYPLSEYSFFLFSPILSVPLNKHRLVESVILICKAQVVGQPSAASNGRRPVTEELVSHVEYARSPCAWHSDVGLYLS